MHIALSPSPSKDVGDYACNDQSSAPSGASIESFELIEISNGARIVTDFFGFPINLQQFGPITLRAKTVGSSSRVEFYLDGELIHREYEGPYLINGNAGDQYENWEPPVNRWIHITAIGTTDDGCLVFKFSPLKFVQQ